MTRLHEKSEDGLYVSVESNEKVSKVGPFITSLKDKYVGSPRAFKGKWKLIKSYKQEENEGEST